LSSPNPNIDLDANAGGTIDNPSQVGGIATDLLSPGPVADFCDENTSLPSITITRDLFDDLKDKATQSYGNFLLAGNPTWTNQIIAIGGDFDLVGTVTFQGENVLIVDDNVTIDAGAITTASSSDSVIILVETGNINLINGANVDIDGAVVVGTVDVCGGNLSGGSLTVDSSSVLEVDGSLIVVNGNDGNGNIAAVGNGKIQVNYQPVTNSNILTSSYSLVEWRVGN
jgi:hypothetical protein